MPSASGRSNSPQRGARGRISGPDPGSAGKAAACHCNVEGPGPTSSAFETCPFGRAHAGGTDVRSQEAARRPARLANSRHRHRPSATRRARPCRWPRTIRWPPARSRPCCLEPAPAAQVTGTAVKLGGLAAIGGLAYKAYQNYKAGNAPGAGAGSRRAGIAAAARGHRLPPVAGAAGRGRIHADAGARDDLGGQGRRPCRRRGAQEDRRQAQPCRHRRRCREIPDGGAGKPARSRHAGRRRPRPTRRSSSSTRPRA